MQVSLGQLFLKTTPLGAPCSEQAPVCETVVREIPSGQQGQSLETLLVKPEIYPESPLENLVFMLELLLKGEVRFETFQRLNDDSGAEACNQDPHGYPSKPRIVRLRNGQLFHDGLEYDL